MVRLSRTARMLSVLRGSLIFAVLIATPQCALAQGTNLTPHALVNPPAKNTPNPKATAQPPNSLIDTAAIVERLNQELGIDLSSITAGWPHELDRIEGELSHPRPRYSDLNRLRGDLQRLRAEIDGTSIRIQPRLDADKAQMNLLVLPQP